MKRNLFIILFASWMLGATIGMTVAQDATSPAPVVTEVVTAEPTPAPVVTPAPVPDVPPVFTAPNPDDVINAAFLALLAAFSTGILSPLTATIVSLVKRIKISFIQNASGEQINLAIAALLSIVMWAGSHFGFGQQVVTGYKLLYAVLPILAGTGANFLSNQSVYEAVKGNIPVIGYSRTAQG